MKKVSKVSTRANNLVQQDIDEEDCDLSDREIAEGSTDIQIAIVNQEIVDSR